MQYSMLLGTQVIGCLISSGYNGTMKVKTQDDVYAAWLSTGNVTSLRCQKYSEQDTLLPLLDINSGEIELKPETISTSRVNYQKELETVVLGNTIDLTAKLPLWECLQVAQSTQNPSSDLTTADKIKLLQEKAGKGIDLATLKNSLHEKEFWKVFIVGSSGGYLSISYRHHLTNCIVKYHSLLDSEIKKFMGAAISQSFNKKIDQSIIEWKDLFTDPLYGAKPFEAWVKAIQIAALEIIPSTIADKMLNKVVSGLAPYEQKIIKALV